MLTSQYQKATLIDASAITFSGLCAIHCLALPVIAVFLPLAGIVAEAEWLHKVFVLAALPFSGLALFQSWGKQRVVGFVLLGGAGLAQLIAAAFIEPLHDYEKLLTVSGALMLATGHFLRWQNHRH